MKHPSEKLNPRTTGRFGKLTVRHGKGSRRRGPKSRLVPLINGADQSLRWFIEDVWGQFDADHLRLSAATVPVGAQVPGRFLRASHR